MAHGNDDHSGRTVGLAEVSSPPVALLMTLDQPRAEQTWPGEPTSPVATIAGRR